MRGLALEGGGARGAYHIGVVKAYIENGYEFDGFVGTSIGAVNAAILAQGDFDKALELWSNISMEQLFDLEEITEKGFRKIIKEGGVDTTKMKAFLEAYIHEEKVRQSGKDFGLVTISLGERKPYEILLEDITEGKLVNYIMASASFPGFRPEVIDEKKFLDGGLYNNCPVNLLLEKGYDEIIAVRTNNMKIFRKIEQSEKIQVISTRESLGGVLNFTQENCVANIRLGYFDGLRAIKNLRGRYYYIEHMTSEIFEQQLLELPTDVIMDMSQTLELPKLPPRRLLFEFIIPQLGAHLKLEKEFDYADFVIALLEHSAKQKRIARFHVYTYEAFHHLIKVTTVASRPNPLSPHHKKSAALEQFINVVIFGHCKEGRDKYNKKSERF